MFLWNKKANGLSAWNQDVPNLNRLLVSTLQTSRFKADDNYNNSYRLLSNVQVLCMGSAATPMLILQTRKLQPGRRSQPGPRWVLGWVSTYRVLVGRVMGASLLSVLVSTSLMRGWCDRQGLKFPELSSLKGQLGILRWKLAASEFSVDPGTLAYRAGDPPRAFKHPLTVGKVCKRGSCFLGRRLLCGKLKGHPESQVGGACNLCQGPRIEEKEAPRQRGVGLWHSLPTVLAGD